MKKRKLLLMPVLALLLAGCRGNSSSSNDTLVSIAHKSGLKSEYVQGEAVSLANVEIEATYANSTRVVKGSSLTFTPDRLDTSIIGPGSISIAYQDKTTVWDYNVTAYFEIDNVERPAFMVKYENNIKEQTNKRTEFMDREQGYAVGTDNAFKYFPTIFAYDYRQQYVELETLPMHLKVEEQNATTKVFTEIAAQDVETYVDADPSVGTYHFQSAALGKTYRLTVWPVGEDYATNPKYRSTFTVNIVEGYNVYTQEDLSHFDNVGAFWNEYRTAKGITPLDINGVIFHNDISIEREFLPDDFFYMDGDADVSTSDADYERVVDEGEANERTIRVVGSLRDNLTLYQRDVPVDEHFVFNGNYFNLNYVNLPLVIRETNQIKNIGEVISHSTVIQGGLWVEPKAKSEQGKFTLKNLSVTGNANRDDNHPEKSGGAIFVKISSVVGHIYNTIASQTFTAYFPKYSSSETTLEKARGYDSFSSMIYSYGAVDFIIKDSELVGSGGPVIITDHVGGDEITGEGGYPANTKVINSKLESWVAGTENWFKLVKADAVVPQLSPLGTHLLPAYGTNTITRTVKIEDQDVVQFNLLGVLKSGRAQPTSDKIRGTFQIDEEATLDFDGPFMQGTQPFPVAMPRFQSSGGQVALYNGDYLVDQFNTPIMPLPPAGTRTENYFTGDYMNLYLNVALPGMGSGTGYMGLVLGLATPV